MPVVGLIAVPTRNPDDLDIARQQQHKLELAVGLDQLHDGVHATVNIAEAVVEEVVPGLDDDKAAIELIAEPKDPIAYINLGMALLPGLPGDAFGRNTLRNADASRFVISRIKELRLALGARARSVTMSVAIAQDATGYGVC